MTIDALPTAPNRNMTPEAFVAAADAWVAAMSTFASQVNADLNLILNLSGLLATSVTSVLIGAGSKSFTVETNKAYLAGQSVRVYSTATPANYMLGTVTSYDAGTGALVVNVTSVGGSGTLAAWTVVLEASGEWLGNATTASGAKLTGSFTATLTGCTTSPTKTFYYEKFGDWVRISFNGESVGVAPLFSGTSNANTMTITGVPTELRPAHMHVFSLLSGFDNGVATEITASIRETGVITLCKGISTAGGNQWTSSGTKGLVSSEFFYHLG